MSGLAQKKPKDITQKRISLQLKKRLRKYSNQAGIHEIEFIKNHPYLKLTLHTLIVAGKLSPKHAIT